MHINVIPEVVSLVGATYIVKLRGTALLADQARGWIRQAGRWRSARLYPGGDIEVDVRRAGPHDCPATPFEIALTWVEDRPEQGPILWSGSYRVLNAVDGPVLEEAG
jgi:hypothetical protein